MSDKKIITYEDLQQHKTKDNLYILLHGKVYNVKEFIDEHPGGDEVMLAEAGKDATEAFEDVGHSDEARELLEKLYVGEFEKDGALKVKQAPSRPQSSNLPSNDSSRYYIYTDDTGVAGGVLQMQGFRHDFGLLDKSNNELVNITFQVAGIGDLAYIYGGRFLAGIGVGAMSMLGPTYVAEVAPKEVRGRITGLFQVCLTIGIAISYWIVYGVNVHIPNSTKQWRIPIGFQSVPVGVMFILLFFCRESPSLTNLAWFRRLPIDHPDVGEEFTEILATVKEERESKGTLHECLKRGHWIRFLIAWSMFTLQQWSGQNSIGYYAPEVFLSVGIKGTDSTLLASGIYGLVKVIATTVFLVIGIEQFGRKKSLVGGAFLMGTFFFILGGLMQTHPPNPNASHASGASIAMAVMIYLYVIPYCFSWGPVPWVYCSEIFSNNLRSYGVAWAAATQWFWNFVVSYVTPMLENHLSKGGVFFFFAAINIFSCIYALFLPETRGLSLEDMDVLFGAVSVEARRRDRLVVHNNLIGAGSVYYYPDQSTSQFKNSEVSMSMPLQDVADSKGTQSDDRLPVVSASGNPPVAGGGNFVQRDRGRERERERRTSLSHAIPPLNVYLNLNHDEFDEEYKRSPITPVRASIEGSGVGRGVWTIPECSEEEARESNTINKGPPL
ncbi:hypothetical protein Clacol_001425 [Clathrus columnatus]|uniref:Major facilitator superfamily (MFS) profile domain-containing protein n=1 Tax=Clathrus columnatus TaxID=1419009 RepID=A0AAV5A5P7_9AGAM|nr:hypothetical protein Clacol_001425 [Clathrus columnatus]